MLKDAIPSMADVPSPPPSPSRNLPESRKFPEFSTGGEENATGEGGAGGSSSPKKELVGEGGAGERGGGEISENVPGGGGGGAPAEKVDCKEVGFVESGSGGEIGGEGGGGVLCVCAWFGFLPVLTIYSMFNVRVIASTRTFVLTISDAILYYYFERDFEVALNLRLTLAVYLRSNPTEAGDTTALTEAGAREASLRTTILTLKLN